MRSWWPPGQRASNAFFSSLSLAVGLLAWEVAATVWRAPAFPPISAVVRRMFEMAGDGVLWSNLASSLQNLVVGFAIAAVLGVLTGVAMALSTRVEQALDIYVNALLTAPTLVFAPVLFSLFGLGRASIIAVVVLYSMFIIVVNTVTALKTVPVSLVEMAACYGASTVQVFFRVMVPFALPLILAGMRLGVGRAVKGMLNGEMFIAVVGLGAVVSAASQSSDAEATLAVLLVIVIVASIAINLVQLIDRRLTGWLPDTARGH